MRMRTPQPLEEASFDLTPMIDVVLLLIIFFMFTTHFAKSQLSAMDLPKERGEPAKENSTEAEFTIEMDRQGAMRVLGREATMEQVSDMLRADLSNAAMKTRVVVRADRNCQAAHLNRLVSGLIGMGVRDWKLATASESAGVGGAP